MTKQLYVPEENLYVPHTERLSELSNIVYDSAKNCPRDKILSYHNVSEHVFDPRYGVAAVAYAHALNEGLDAADVERTVAAAYVHDWWMQLVGSEKHEYSSVQHAIPFLYRVGFKDADVEKISGGVLSTEVNFDDDCYMTKPKSLIGMILADADVDNFGRPDFFEKGDALRRELGMPDGKGWYQNTLNLMDRHKWYSNSAELLRGEGKKDNMSFLEKKIASYD